MGARTTQTRPTTVTRSEGRTGTAKARWICALLLAVSVATAGLPAIAVAANGKASKRAAAPVKDLTTDEGVAQAWRAFCEEWMQKLAARERENIDKTEWKDSGQEKTGNHVGYGPDHECRLSAQGAVPIGRIYYKEVTYRRHGNNVTEARACTPEPVEVYEVTEIFRYNHGKWEF